MGLMQHGSCAPGAELAVRLYVRYCSCNGESFIISNTIKTFRVKRLAWEMKEVTLLLTLRLVVAKWQPYCEN